MVGYLTAVASDICIEQPSNDSADTKSARDGPFQEKKKNSDYWYEQFPLGKFFDGKNCQRIVHKKWNCKTYKLILSLCFQLFHLELIDPGNTQEKINNFEHLTWHVNFSKK